MPTFTSRVHRCLSIDAGSHETTSFNVYCPMEGRSIGVGSCNTCARCLAMPASLDAPDARILCDVPEAAAGRHATNARLSSDVTVAAAQVVVHEIMEPVTAVEQDMCVGDLRRLAVERGARAVVVVDADRRPVGIVSHVDLLREDAAVVGDAMTPIVHTLPEAARLSSALALMAIEGVHQVPIVGEDDTLLGVITSTTALRWVVRRMGYVL